MANTVFYAWQSDRNPSACRFLIRNAAKAAIKSLFTDADAENEIEDAPEILPLELDHDTKGIPGTPRIVETIVAKIKKCSMFIADVTLVGSTMTDDGRKKHHPNSNVLIELGMAASEVGWERIILVMNTAYGKVEDLPFDMKDRRHPIQYHCNPTKDDTKTAQAELAKVLKTAIRDIHKAVMVEDQKDAELKTKAQKEQLLADYLNAAQEGKENAYGHLVRFLDECRSELPAFAISPSKDSHLDDLIVSRITEMKPLRNKILTAFECTLLYAPKPEFIEAFAQFLEDAAKFQERSAYMTHFYENQFDQYRFCLHELFQYLAALTFKRGKFQVFNDITERSYVSPKSELQYPDNFAIFASSLRSFNDRKQRLQSRSISLVSDAIKERADFAGVSFDDLMQADFTLGFKSVTVAGDTKYGRIWYPWLMGFKQDAYIPFPLYSNLRTPRNFEFIKTVFKVNTTAEWIALVKREYAEHFKNMQFGGWPVDFAMLAGLKALNQQ